MPLNRRHSRSSPYPLSGLLSSRAKSLLHFAAPNNLTLPVFRSVSSPITGVSSAIVWKRKSHNSPAGPRRSAFVGIPAATVPLALPGSVKAASRFFETAPVHCNASEPGAPGTPYPRGKCSGRPVTIIPKLLTTKPAHQARTTPTAGCAPEHR